MAKPFGSLPQVPALSATPTGNPPAGALLLYFKSDGKLYSKNSSGTETLVSSAGGDVVGPASSTSGNVPSFNGVTGKLLQDSGVAVANIDTLNGSQSISGTKTFTTAPLSNYATSYVFGYASSVAEQIGMHPAQQGWSDHLRFRVPTLERSTDGSTWVTETATNAGLIVSGRGDQSYTWPSTYTYLRTTWSNASYINFLSFRYLELSFAWQATSQNISVTVETSTDGVTWTTRHSGVTALVTDNSMWIECADWGGDSYLRITMQNTTGTANLISSEISLWSLRKWNQGGGWQNFVPYGWNADKTMQANANWYPASNNAYQLGLSSNRWSKMWATDADFSGNVTIGSSSPEVVSNKSTSTALGVSDTFYPSQKAVKTYVDTQDALREPAITAGTAAQFWRGDKTWQALLLSDLPDAWVKRSVKAASLTNMTIPPGGTTLSVDGVTLANGDRILLKNQTAASENGIWVVSGIGSSVNIGRATDADTAAEVSASAVVVDQGTQGGTAWRTTFKSTDTLGTTLMRWYQVLDSSQANISAGYPQLNGSGQVGDAQLQTRIQGTGQQVTDDWNLYTSSGWYYSTTGAIPLNHPEAGNAYNVMVSGRNSTNCTQLAMRTNSTNSMWIRQQSGGTWTAWEQVQTKAIADAAYEALSNKSTTTTLGTSNTLYPTQNAVKTYVDTAVSGVVASPATALVATTANITLSGTQTIDGVPVASGDTVLVKNQTTASTNGVYKVSVGAWSRSVSFDTAAKLAGTEIAVLSGTLGGGKQYYTSFKSTDTLGTTSMSWFPSKSTRAANTQPTDLQDGELWWDADSENPGAIWDVLQMTGDYASTTPSAPSVGLKAFSRNRGRRLLATVGPSGQDTRYQPALFTNRIARLSAINASTVISLDGLAVQMVNAGATGPNVNTAVTMASTNFFTSMVRTRVGSTATAGTAGNVRSANAQWFLSPTANMGGFYFVCRFGLNTVGTNTRGFIGMTSQTAAYSAGSNPSTQSNQIGFLWDTGQTNMQFSYNGTGGATTVDLGSAYATSVGTATYFYEAVIFCPSGLGQFGNYAITRLNDGVVAQGSFGSSGLTGSSGLPATGTLLAAQVSYGNGTNAAAHQLDLQSLYIESDN